MDSLPLKNFNNGFAVYWLELSGLELTKASSYTVNSFFKVTITWCSDLYINASKMLLLGKQTLPTWCTLSFRLNITFSQGVFS